MLSRVIAFSTIVNRDKTSLYTFETTALQVEEYCKGNNFKYTKYWYKSLAEIQLKISDSEPRCSHV